MKWTEKQIRYVIQDMIEENPLACRGLFKVSAVKFSNDVDTMAVSISSSPVLFINLDFCCKHLETENDVKAVLLHEFLHVLLLHTEKYRSNSPLLNFCLDAVINAIIYRNQGDYYANFFVRFYKWEKMSFLLRPQSSDIFLEKEWMDIHKSIYEGKYCGDDLYELLDYLQSKFKNLNFEQVVLLGNHELKPEAASEEVNVILDEILKKMNGVKIWNKSKTQSYGGDMKKSSIEAEKYRQHLWDRSTMKVLKKCLVTDKEKKPVMVSQEMSSPILCGSDKRSLSKYIWSGLLPFSTIPSSHYRSSPGEKVHVYLDVSGSMRDEINGLVNLLCHFKVFIKRPLWVFSDVVKEAFFINERLEYDTSYGTRLAPVFDHMRKNKISKALIVTDGFVDSISDEILEGIVRSNVQVLLSANGNPDEFEARGIPYTRLDSLKTKKEN